MQLLREYRETSRSYADRVSDMSDLVGCGLESEVALLRRACRTTWEAVEHARMALSRHEADHSCDREDLLLLAR